ncbi:hypothetical protein Pcinc_036517 [Petrolisthes cinctipes]|uniref:Uncharacterized protein n=1 Tax=Petrolisthes cinctipes TaxID=88211 RepID=A0AAE1BW03_PETCI|nr:hypothetical protein Pcinc_036517 [Petrolisthes cinctipes]
MPLALITKLLELLSRQMLTAVQASLDTFLLITGGTGGDLKTEEDFILSLNNFECRARSVEVIRQKLLRYMFPVFSLILVCSTFTFTIAAYFLIQGVLLRGGDRGDIRDGGAAEVQYVWLVLPRLLHVTHGNIPLNLTHTNIKT